MRRPALAAIVLSGLPAVCGPPSTVYGAPQQKPTFRSGVEVVLIDVNVVDSSHKPVGDLKPEDFVVSVDYKPRKVVSAQFVRYDVRTSTTTVKETLPATAGKAVDRSPARNVLVVVDTDSMEPGDGLLVQREAGKFLDKLAPDDRIGVVTIPRVQSVVTMTKNREEVRAALAKVITGSDRYRPMHNIGIAEALDVERGFNDVAQKIIARECPRGGEPGCAEAVAMEIRQLQLDAHMQGLRTVEALRDLGRSLAKIEGPKTMLLVSGGTPPPDIKTVSAYSDAAAGLAAGQVTLYTLYIRQELLVQSKGRPSPTPMEDMDVVMDGLANTTSAAGGTFMEAIGTFDQYFERVVTELSGSYVVGIEVQASDRDGRPHQVSVKVNRKGLEVRGRKQYVIEAAGKSAPASSQPRALPGTSAAAVRYDAARGLTATPAELQPLVEQAGKYAQAYQDGVLALLSEERLDLRLSKKDSRAAWTIAAERHLAAENLLVAKSSDAGWDVVRDVFEVDGQTVRPRDGRLRAMFLEGPDSVVARAAAINAASVAHEIGFVNRSTTVATGPLVFVNAEHRDHFVFARQGESAVAGVPVVQIAFEERGEPRFVSAESGHVPISGAMWVDPKDGSILKTFVRWEADGTTAEITVTYERATDGSMWVPAEMTEIYTSAVERLECATKFLNYKKYVAKGK